MKTQTSHQGTKKQPHISSEAPSGPAVSHDKLASPVTSSFDDLHARICARAYASYVERGRRDGYAVEDWLEAEGEVSRRAFSG